MRQDPIQTFVNHIQSQPHSEGVGMLEMAAVILLMVGVLCFPYQRYLGVGSGRAASLALLSLGIGIGLAFYRYSQIEHFHGDDLQEFLAGLSVALAGFLPVVAIPFIFKLYLKWVGGQLSEAEKAPGMDGVRAWLRGGNAFCILLISLCVWMGFGYSFFAVLALTVIATLAYPLLNMTSNSFQPVPERKGDDLSPEREKVLKMLEEGKVTAQESAELLNALGHTVQARAPQATAAAPHRKLVLAGLGLLLIGFFLPWFSINPGEELNRTMGEAQAQIGQAMPQGFNLTAGIPMTFKTGSVNIAGGDIKYGLGWFVLLLGIAAAVLPYFANNLEAQIQQKAILIGLSIGGIILVYLLTSSMRYVSIGILLGLVGYALQFVGTLKDHQMAVR